MIYWFQIGKGVHQGYILSPYLLNLYAEYTMQHARMDEAQARFKIVRININNLRYSNNNSYGRSEEQNGLLMKVKE